MRPGKIWTITTRDVSGNNEISPTTYKGLPGDVTAGDTILIDDGKVRLRVVEVDGTEVHTMVEIGGRISDHKGINLPGVPVSVPAMSEKDIEDLRWALHLTVDFVALSFVRTAKDVEDVRQVMREEGVLLPVIAKIEKPQAIDNLDEVIKAFDGFMVARGDLGVECPLEDVPFLQKPIVEKARRNAKPVIVATQMLETMISNPTPTRAEASDVANAMLDGADAVMLSGETSVGEYPIETVRTMARIVTSTEQPGAARRRHRAIDWQPKTPGGVIAKAAARSPSGSGRSTWSRSPRAATPPAGCRAARFGPGAGLHPRGTNPLAAVDDLGRGDVQDGGRRAHRRDGLARSTSSCSRSAGSRRASSSSSSPAARPASRARPTPCGSTGWATRSTASLRRTDGTAARGATGWTSTDAQCTVRALTSRPLGAPGGIRTHTECLFEGIDSAVGLPGPERRLIPRPRSPSLTRVH